MDRNSVAVTDEELDLLVELLARELDLLPAEIHHTFARAYRQSLRSRMELVERLLARLRDQQTRGAA